VAGQRHIWRGELEHARQALVRLLTLADERGEQASYVLVNLHISELELRCGQWDAACSRLDEWAESSERELTFRPQYQRCRALLAAGRGDVAETERWAGDAISRAGRTGSRWDELEARRARGMVALRAGAPQRALLDLRVVWEHTTREGVLEPGVFPVAPDLVESLVDTNATAEARAVTDRLARLASQQDHPWAQATVKRCRALLSPGADHAAARLRAATGEFERLGLRFDAARSMLAIGRIQRRAKQWRAARDSLSGAQAAFEQLGSPGWAELARSEHERIAGRRPAAGGELTGHRATSRGARGRWAGQQADRERPRRHRAHGRGAPRARLREARGAFPVTARRSSRRQCAGTGSRPECAGAGLHSRVGVAERLRVSVILLAAKRA
jgi:hypothetical protein